MPHYRYQCARCAGEFETWQSIHSDALTSHDELVPQLDLSGFEAKCGGSLKRVISVPAIVGIKAAVRSVDDTEARWSKDMPAYKRLRRDGMQPPAIDGAARVETLASNEFEVRDGAKKKIPEERMREGMAQAKEILAGRQ
jgi:predicted nucleic acid-binding Zn ribbon protein